MKIINSVLFIPAILCAEYAPDLVVRPEVDEFINRLSTRHALVVPHSWYTQPMTIASLATFIAAADSCNKAGVLSETESYTLKRIKSWMYDDRCLYAMTDTAKDTRLKVHLNLSGKVYPTYLDSGSVFVRGTISPVLVGNIGRLSYFSSIDVWTDYLSDSMYTTSTYQPYDGIPYNLYGRKRSSHMRSSDVFRAGITYITPFATIETGIDKIKQGPVVYYPLAFSGTVPPITYARVSAGLGSLNYSHGFGMLKSQKDRDKYIYMHRLTIPLFAHRLTCGISEAVVYGSTNDLPDSLDPYNRLQRKYYGQTRGIEWSYLIPFVPFAFAQHYGGDRDNATISLDGDLRWPEHFRWYAEFLIDDITAPWTILNNDFGNKWAITIGGQHFGRVMGKDMVSTVEVSRVEPWVYTHFYGGSHNYVHFGQCIGSPLGPNSLGFTASSKMAVSRWHSIGLQIEYTAKGFGRGSNVSDVFQDTLYRIGDSLATSEHPDAHTKEFLSPDYRSTTDFSVVYSVAPFEMFSLEGKFTMGSTKRTGIKLDGKFSF